MKVGRSERACAAVNAHSGALSGEDRVVDAYFRQLGIVRARDLDDLVQIAQLKSGLRLGVALSLLTLRFRAAKGRLSPMRRLTRTCLYKIFHLAWWIA